MDKFQATKILTERLVEHSGRLVISDEHYKNRLVDGARYSYVTGGYIDVLYMRDNPNIWYERRDSKGKEKKGSLREVIKDFIPEGTNYLFSSASAPTKMSDFTTLINVTPYAIIGDKEIESIKGLFYKTYDHQVREAIDTLGIKDFFELYNAYLDGNPRFSSLFFQNFEKFKKELLGFSQSLEYDHAEETRLSQFENRFGVLALNSQLKKLNIDFYFIKEASWIKKRDVDRLVKLLQEHTPPLETEDALQLDFLRFVFQLPYEDQNLEVNKFLFKKFNHALHNTKTVLLKEYRQGRHFKEYFELLDNNQQKQFVSIIKHSKLQTTDYNTFLWSKGFKDVGLDYLKLYKESANDFIEYFGSRSIEEKKVILKDIMDYEFLNEKVISWLNENEPGLVREVGLSND